MSDVFSVADDEDLIPTKVKRNVYTSYNVITNEKIQTIGHYTVSFSRKKAGNYILGGASSMQISISTDGTLIGLKFDWPIYSETDIFQSVVEKKEILSRSGVIFSKIAKNGQTTSSPKILVCGYYDPGFKKHQNNYQIQAACLVSKKVNDSGQNSLILVPAARTPIEDDAWLELSKIDQ